ncbi:alanine racemase [Corynebacterium sp. H113]|uniref:alanine racemase n=1 Tax=Corynebacterium sp. H113 TaxID=3133419 RepID=UPI0030AF2999
MASSSTPTTHLLSQIVDTDAVAHNVRVIKEAAGVSQLMAVVKADGYAQGANKVARAALGGGATQLGVATLQEALDLRDSLELRDDNQVATAENDRELAMALVPREVPILAWLWHPDESLEVEAAVASRIQLGIPSLAHAKAAADAGLAVNICPKVTLMVDTGLNRSGISMANGDFEKFLPALVEMHRRREIMITGVFTHFACADEPDHPSIDMQADRFRQSQEMLADAGVPKQVNHAANSPAALTRPDLAFDMVRPGLAVYGLEPIPGQDHGLKPVMRWEAKVLLVKDIPAGESVSYGQLWTAERDSTIAVIPCGYADGMPRATSGKFEVAINGKRYKQVGRVCMDQFVIELGPASGVTAGDTAVIVGGGDSATFDNEPTADELAEAAGTINYEILTAPKGRTVRSYRGQWA